MRRADHSYRRSHCVWCVCECNREASTMRPWPTRGRCPTGGGGVNLTCFGTTAPSLDCVHAILLYVQYQLTYYTS